MFKVLYSATSLMTRTNTKQAVSNVAVKDEGEGRRRQVEPQSTRTRHKNKAQVTLAWHTALLRAPEVVDCVIPVSGSTFVNTSSALTCSCKRSRFDSLRIPSALSTTKTKKKNTGLRSKKKKTRRQERKGWHNLPKNCGAFHQSSQLGLWNRNKRKEG